jgi:hypothetical protein
LEEGDDSDMSRKKSDRQADALPRKTEAANDRMALFEFDQRMERQAELDQQRRQQLLAAARQEDAKDRLEAEVAELAAYRQQAIAAALSNKSLAPQVAAMIPAGLTSREEINNFVQLGITKTSEILAEIAGQGEPTIQSLDKATGRFIPQEPAAPADQIVIDKNLSLKDYVEKVRPAMNIGNRDAGIFG